MDIPGDCSALQTDERVPQPEQLSSWSEEGQPTNIKIALFFCRNQTKAHKIIEVAHTTLTAVSLNDF